MDSSLPSPPEILTSCGVTQAAAKPLGSRNVTPISCHGSSPSRRNETFRPTTGAAGLIFKLSPPPKSVVRESKGKSASGGTTIGGGVGTTGAGVGNRVGVGEGGVGKGDAGAGVEVGGGIVAVGADGIGVPVGATTGVDVSTTAVGAGVGTTTTVGVATAVPTNVGEGVGNIAVGWLLEAAASGSPSGVSRGSPPPEHAARDASRTAATRHAPQTPVNLNYPPSWRQASAVPSTLAVNYTPYSTLRIVPANGWRIRLLFEQHQIRHSGLGRNDEWPYRGHENGDER